MSDRHDQLEAELLNMRRRMRRLTATNVLLAVVLLAFGGATAAYAVTLAPANSVNTGAIIDRTIGTPDVKVGAFAGQTILDNSMTTRDIRDGTVSSADVGDNSLTSADIGSGQVRAGDLGTITQRVAYSPTFPAGSTSSATATCLPGERVISGGFDGPTWAYARSSIFWAPNGWLVSSTNLGPQDAQIQAYVYCLAS